MLDSAYPLNEKWEYLCDILDLNDAIVRHEMPDIYIKEDPQNFNN